MGHQGQDSSQTACSSGYHCEHGIQPVWVVAFFPILDFNFFKGVKYKFFYIWPLSPVSGIELLKLLGFPE